ncbi:MAG: HNH endonuclease [Desulfitobacteriaceae bacterium]
MDLHKHAWGIFPVASRVIRKLGGHLVPANQVSNLQDVHQQYTKKIAAIQDGNRFIGITSLSFCKWRQIQLKNQKETPYTIEGRELYLKRTGKKTILPRHDELLSFHLLSKARNKGSPLYNFEYFLNRGYTFNRDNGQCRVCGEYLNETNVEFHHIQTILPLELVNRVPNLASVCTTCHELIHSNCNISKMSRKISYKLTGMREKLTQAKTVG